MISQVGFLTILSKDVCSADDGEKRVTEQIKSGLREKKRTPNEPRCCHVGLHACVCVNSSAYACV